MSFTQDELQSFNTILEQKLALHRRELERSLDQRMSVLKSELEQLQPQQSFEIVIERALAAQLLAIEELINQRLPRSGEPAQIQMSETYPGADALEMQAEISWDDLVDVIDRMVSSRFSSLEEAIQSMARNIERALLTQLRNLRSDMIQARQSYSGDITNVQDVFTSIEQLEHIIESLQVAMTANQTLLSNRLYHHQHLPLERAHATAQPPGENNVHSGEENHQLPQSEE